MSKTTDKLLANTIDDGGCLVWQSGAVKGHPQASVRGKCLMVRRVLWEALKGPLADGELVRCTCNTPKCINLDHCEKTTRRKLGQELGAAGRMGGFARSAANAKAKRASAQAKLTDEAVRRIREGSEAASELSEALGVSAGHVNKVRRGEARQDFTNPFAGLLA